ncbi:MAG: NAD(P)H-hydrate dehydratase [Bacteroidaceae bacterium]|nr:NAD(P)H-hydrate dehydratase [Bacteroidaceae bacterium]
MKFFPTQAIKEIDRYTIDNEPVASIDLMERAARALASALLERYAGRSFALFCGPGNNGGDGLAVARMLNDAGCCAAAWLINPKGKLSPDCAVNLKRLQDTAVTVYEVNDSFIMPALGCGTVIVDALFGSGLNKPVSDGLFACVIEAINASECEVVAVDMPSGLMGENNDPQHTTIVKADLTLTLQFPKMSLLFAENSPFVGEMKILDIGLSQEWIDKEPSPLFFTDEKDIKSLLSPRAKHSHKGDYGRALLVAGSKGMAGASVLSARAVLRSGVGLLTVHVPACNNAIVQVAVPEAMTSIDCSECCFSDFIETSKYNAVAVGPGLGQSSESEKALLHLIDNCRVPMVLDADALNVLARNSEYLRRLPQGSVLTPHPGEFARLFGKTPNTYLSISAVRAFARDCGFAVVLKGTHTVVIAPDGNLYFNSTGNPGMATGGSGDVLTGMVLALLAQGYSATDAARMAVYVHGLSGDYAAAEKGMTALVAGDIVDCLPAAWKYMERKEAVE